MANIRRARLARTSLDDEPDVRSRGPDAAARQGRSRRLDEWTRPDQTRCVPQEIINISEAKAQLSRLIEEVRKGKTIIIGKAGKPVAKLLPCEPGDEPRVPGALRGKIRIADDFDELPADVAAALGMVDEP
ncbi:MAG: type II toxin-antitoxin system prevent-host-death family antitoxin [Deltaproteobacteria bacterium]|nr:type II toxin-antitoxin system prevent-host-death family antitoxin [Deltaproteobacteria bacterium]